MPTVRALPRGRRFLVSPPNSGRGDVADERVEDFAQEAESVDSVRHHCHGDVTVGRIGTKGTKLTIVPRVEINAIVVQLLYRPRECPRDRGSVGNVRAPGSGWRWIERANGLPMRGKNMRRSARDPRPSIPGKTRKPAGRICGSAVRSRRCARPARSDRLPLPSSSKH